MGGYGSRAQGGARLEDEIRMFPAGAICPLLTLGSGLVDQSQKSTVAARARAEKNTFGQRSYPVATRLQAAEHDLDAVAELVTALVVIDVQGAELAARNARLNALLLERVSEPFGVIASIGQQPLRFGQVVEQGRCASVIADLASRDEEAQRAVVGIGNSVKLGVHTALGPSDQAVEIPLFTPRLDAVR